MGFSCESLERKSQSSLLSIVVKTMSITGVTELNFGCSSDNLLLPSYLISRDPRKIPSDPFESTWVRGLLKLHQAFYRFELRVFVYLGANSR